MDDQKGMKGRHSGSFLSFTVGKRGGEIKVGSIRWHRVIEQRMHI
jgi:hypothetical protein